MRIGFLVGACGLALAGASHADAAARDTRANGLDNDFVRARDAVVGKPGSAQRLQFIDQAREKVRTGVVNPRRSTLIEIGEEVIAGDSYRGRTIATDRVAPTVGNPNPWAAMIDGDDMHDGLEDPGYVAHVSLSSLSDLRPLRGQVAPNGNVWKTAATRVYNGIVDNAIAQTGVSSDGMGGFNPPGSGYYGEVGGPDAGGAHGKFFAAPRGSVLDLTTTAFDTSFQWVCRLDHQFFVPTGSTPVVTVIDWYIDTLDTFTWFRPVSSPEGFIITNIFMAGLDFATFAPFTNGSNQIDRPIVLGLKPGSPDEGEFFAADTHILKTREWFNVALRQSSDSFSVWLRDSETTATGAFAGGTPFGFVDASSNMFNGDTSGVDGIIPFEGEIFENGWGQFFPGVKDDPATTSVIEGDGIARNTFEQVADVFLDATGSPAGGILFAFGCEEIQVVGGFDWPPAFAPGFVPTDWYWDNYTVMGEPFDFADPQPDSTLPYFDDMELWTPGPVAIQGDRWFDLFSFSEIVDNQNATTGLGLDGGAPTQSLRNTNIFGDTSYRGAVDLELFEEDFLARASGATTMTHDQTVRVSDNLTGRGFDATGSGFRSSRVMLGGRDSNGVVDNRLYLWGPNPDYDNSQPQSERTGENQIWTGVENWANYAIPLADANTGGTATTVAPNTWNRVKVDVIVGVNGNGTPTVSYNAVQQFIDGDYYIGLGATEPSLPNSGVEIDEITFETGNELGGLLSQSWWDDVRIDGLREQEPSVLQVGGLPYTAQPLFELPYVDPFDGYTYELAFSGQGATPFLGNLLSGENGQVDVIPLDGAASPGDPVYLYTVNTIVSQPGTLPVGVAPTNTVAVLANFPDFRDPDAVAVPGNAGETRVNFRNISLALQAAVDWNLQSTSSSAWDGVTPLVGRYYFVYETRWGGDGIAPFVVDESGNADPDLSARGNILAITQAFISGDSDDGDLDNAVTSTLPKALAFPGTTATMAFDMFIGTDWDRDSNGTPETPRGRTVLDLRGPSFDELQITKIVFGGPNIYIDSDADGTVNNDSIFDAEDDGTGVFPPATNSLYVLRPNANGSVPPGVNIAEGFDVPVNTWLRINATVSAGGAWTASISDFSGARAVLHTMSGSAIDTTGLTEFGLSGLEGLDIEFGNDNGGAGRPRLEKITWTSLGAAATPEAGTDPHNTVFNRIPPKYFYFEILEIDAALTPDPNDLPDVTPVDLVTGAPGALRKLAVNDIVVLWNDTGTAGQGGGGVPTGVTLLDNNPGNTEWIYNDGVGDVAEGTWGALGLPDNAGLNDPVPPGGITSGTPPYTPESPFRTLLMGTITDLPAFPPAVDPHQVLIDNVFLDLVGCKWDIATPQNDIVDGADLALLLAAWGSSNPLADGNSDGNVDGADLASLLAFWGPCP
jgi:hypothetical protein